MKEKPNKIKKTKQKKIVGKRKVVAIKKQRSIPRKSTAKIIEKNRGNKKKPETFLFAKALREFVEKPIVFSIFRATMFALVLVVVVFLLGNVGWEARQFFVEKLETEELEHTVRIKSKLFEMKSQIDFFDKTLNNLEQEDFLTEDELREVNENSRSLSGELNDVERYYLDRRFDYSLEFFQPTSMESEERFEQLKRIIRDGNLFLNDMTNVSLFLQSDQSAKNIVRYDFKLFNENYLKALEFF